MDWPIPEVRPVSALATRSGVPRRPSRFGSSPMACSALLTESARTPLRAGTWMACLGASIPLDVDIRLSDARQLKMRRLARPGCLLPGGPVSLVGQDDLVDHVNDAIARCDIRLDHVCVIHLHPAQGADLHLLALDGLG